MFKRFLLPATIILALAAACTPANKVRPTKNVIFMLTDGTSEGALAAARWYQRYMSGDPTFNLTLDEYICGLIQTHESDGPIPCSAPAMSAYMTGVLGRIGNVSVHPIPHPGEDVFPVDSVRAGQPAATVLEAARILKGKSTGMVFTVPFPHATPAATSAHYPYRWAYHQLGLQQCCQDIDVVFGSGTEVLTDEMRQTISATGATLLEDDVDGFRDFTPGKDGERLWALYGGDMTDFEIDRAENEQPSLTEMTAKAIDMLSRNRKGFFLMVEGSKVDYAAHSKDPVELITELLEFDRAVKVALDFAKKDGNTTVVIAADHGNGGIQIGGGGYANYEANPVDSIYYGIRNVRASSWKMVKNLQGCAEGEIPAVFKEWTGIDLNSTELANIKKNMNRVEGDYMQVANTWNLQGVIARIYLSHSNLKVIGGDHTGEDVILGVYNPRGQRPTGVIRNTQLNAYLCQLLGLKGAVAWQALEPGSAPHNALIELSDEIFAPHTEVFEGCECSIDESGDVPVLAVVCGGDDGASEASATRLLIPAFHNIAMVERRGDVVDTLRLKTPCVWNPDNRTFYLDRSLRELAK